MPGPPRALPPLTPGMEHSSSSFLKTKRDVLVSQLQQELESVRGDLAEAEVEAATWRRIDGTPRLNEATKHRHIKDHLTYWDAEVKRLKDRASQIQTDLDGLPLIQG